MWHKVTSQLLAWLRTFDEIFIDPHSVLFDVKDPVWSLTEKCAVYFISFSALTCNGCVFCYITEWHNVERALLVKLQRAGVLLCSPSSLPCVSLIVFPLCLRCGGWQQRRAPTRGGEAHTRTVTTQGVRALARGWKWKSHLMGSLWKDQSFSHPDDGQSLIHSSWRLLFCHLSKEMFQQSLEGKQSPTLVCTQCQQFDLEHAQWVLQLFMLRS